MLRYKLVGEIKALLVHGEDKGRRSSGSKEIVLEASTCNQKAPENMADNSVNYDTNITYRSKQMHMDKKRAF